MKKMVARPVRAQHRALRSFLIAALVFHQPATTAVIVVGGGCTLADAITSANTDTATGGCTAGFGVDELQLEVDTTLTAALPAIASPIKIRGSGHTIERDAGAPTFGIFSVVGQTLLLMNTTVGNGHAANGGAVFADNYAALIMRDVTLTGNYATDSGGAIYMEDGSTLELFDSRLTNNSAGQRGGAIFHYDNTRVDVTNSTLSGNAATWGGGMYNGWDSPSNLLNSTLTGNSAAQGGGIYNGFYAVANVQNTTISGNYAVNQGGGIYNAIGYGDVVLVNSTVMRNTSGNLYAGFESGTIDVQNSIVAYPLTGSNCDGYTYFIGSGANFDDDSTCPSSSPITAGVDIDLTLDDNGGPTLTHALESGSVAIDAAGACGLATDQRSFDRSDGSCDSGAYELGAAPVSGSVDAVQAKIVLCRNLDTGQSVSGSATDETWDCEALGLAVSSGDTVLQRVRAEVIDGAAGRVFGVSATDLACLNLSTGLSIQAPLTTHAWDCVAEGLVVSPGDRVEMVARGTVLP